MIKPVKRNKRLKWIDSRYAKSHRPEFGITKAYSIRVARDMRDMCNDIECGRVE